MVGTGNGSQGSPDVLAGASLRKLHWDLWLWSVGPLGDETQVPCTAGGRARDGASAHSRAGMEPRLLVPEPGLLHLCTVPHTAV